MKRILAVLGPVVVLVVAAFAVEQAVHGGPQPAPVAHADELAGQSVNGTRGEAAIIVGQPEIRALRCRPLRPQSAEVDYLVVPVTVTVLRGTWEVDPANFLYAPEQKQPGTFSASTAIGFLGEDCDSLPAGTVEAGDSSSGLVYFGAKPTPGEVTYRSRGSGQRDLVTFPVPSLVPR